jgi:DHA3 family macrolide efflux protein-like MFS transporter
VTSNNPTSVSNTEATDSRFRSFIVLWLGQVVSLLGTSLSGFALGIWVYQTTGSVTRFAIIALTTSLPRVLLAPVAGALVDRWSRKRMIILGDTGAALSTLGILLLLSFGTIEPWHIYVATAFAAVCSVAQAPAYSASVPLLVPERHLGRANGMVQLGEAAARIAAPISAGALLGIVGLRGVVLIDLATFVFAIGTLLFVHIPSPIKTAVGQAGKGRLRDEILEGWRYLRGQRGLLALMMLFTMSNFFVGMIEVLVTPLVLSTGTPAELGQVMTIGGVGMLVGSLTMAVWGGPRRRVLGVLGCMALEGVFIAFGGVAPQFLFFSVAAFGFFFLVPIENGSTRALLQSTVPAEMQGRVFAVAIAVAHSALPLGYAVAGPLADRVFSPLLAPTGALADSVGAMIGTGPGRGIGFMFILAGMMYIALSIFGFTYPRLRSLGPQAADGKQASPGEASTAA